MSDIIFYLPKEWTETPISKVDSVDSDYREIQVYFDLMPSDPTPADIFRIIVILEPFNDLKKLMLDYFNNEKDCYNYIFTYHQDILDSFPNSMLSVSPTTWAYDYVQSEKEFSVSTVVGNKHLSIYLENFDGYQVRWDLFNRKEEIRMRSKFYLSSNSPIPNIDYEKNLVLKDSKAPLFSSQFHIAIENTNRIKNAFSEKIIDCFQTRTIPIYYGPSNIGDFFDTRGIFICESVDHIIDVCNIISADTYESLKDAIESNYILSMKYKSMKETIVDSVKKIFGK